MPKSVAPSTATYVAPQKLLVPCAGCGCTVLRGHYGERGLVKYDVPRTPMGEKHVCAEARQRWEPIARYLAGELVATFVRLPDGTTHFMFMELAKGVHLKDLEGEELTFQIEDKIRQEVSA